MLRQEAYFSVRFGSETGETGASAILLDGQLVNADIMLAAQADGHTIETIEGLSKGTKLHPIQEVFIRTGAIQSGYSTPAMILAAKALIERNPDPSEAEVRDALSGILDRESGYVKPVQAILEAAAVLRGEEPSTVELNIMTPVQLPPHWFGGPNSLNDESGGESDWQAGPEMAGGGSTTVGPTVDIRRKVCSQVRPGTGSA